MPLVRIIVIVALMAAIPLFWLNLDAFGISPEDETTKFYLIGGGASVALFGLLYKALGAWDLIPDWIPLLGALDDMVAWICILGGAGAIAAGIYLF